MCEKRTKKLKKGSQVIRLREARRRQRINMTPSPVSNERVTPPIKAPPVIDKTAQNKVILELAWKTAALMQKNKIIQQKIKDLQKETSEYVAHLMRNPQSRENRLRYMSMMRIQAVTAARAHDLSMDNKENNKLFEMRPEAD